MSEIILTSGAYHKYVSGSSIAKTILKHGGYSLTTAVLDILAANTCCTKNIVADSITAGSFTFNGEGYVGVYPLNSPENIAAGTGGPIQTNCFFTTINTDAGGDAFTLADGTTVGQLKKIYLLADGGGNAVITPVNFADGFTITMNDAGDYVVLVWTGTAWHLIENIGSIIV